ncbi:MAG: hypothetical protein KDD22_04375 [Bdellovibrionales bacterium]|nr:hypothetical protein [Bdellovibrionales bacterium]
MSAQRLIIILVLFISVKVHATMEVFEMNTNVRALGMGNAFLGVAHGADAMFYNPAGLARNSGFNWLILDPKLGVSGLEAFESVKDLQSDDGFESAIRELYGDHVWAGAGAKSILTIPFLGVGVYDNLDASLDIDNPAYPNLDVSVVNDFGYVAGLGIPIFPFVHAGMVIKRVKRKGARVPFGPSYIASLDPERIQQNIETEGTGYGLDLGGNIVIPGPFMETVLSAVWKDVGNTTFKSGIEGSEPPSQPQEMSIGAAINVDLPLISVSPAIDIKHLNREDVQLAKKIHLGVEVGLPLIDLRAGLYQGYYTLGAGVSLGFLRVDAATYGVELVAYPGQREDRRYMVQLTLELGFNPGFNILGGSSGSGGSKTARQRGLKQRR